MGFNDLVVEVISNETNVEQAKIAFTKAMEMGFKAHRILLHSAQIRGCGWFLDGVIIDKFSQGRAQIQT